MRQTDTGYMLSCTAASIPFSSYVRNESVMYLAQRFSTFPLALSLVVGFFLSEICSAEDGRLENPVFKSWAAFPVGTKVRYKNETDNGNMKEHKIVQYTLVMLKDETLEVEVNYYLDSKSTTPESSQAFTHRRYFQLPKGVDRSKLGKPSNQLEESEEEVEFQNQKMKTTKTKSKVKVEAGDTFTTSWSSPQIPGGLYKSTSETPATKSVTTIELLSIDIPSTASK